MSLFYIQFTQVQTKFDSVATITKYQITVKGNDFKWINKNVLNFTTINYKNVQFLMAYA